MPSRKLPSNTNIFFDYPRLRLSVAGRLLVRIVSWIALLVFLALTSTLLMAKDVHWMFWTGILMALFLADSLIHFGEGDRKISDLPDSGDAELSKYSSPAALGAIEKAFDKSSIMRTDFALQLCADLIDMREIRETLNRLNVPKDEFKSRALELLKASQGSVSGAVSKAEKLKQIDTLVKSAFSHAFEDGQVFVEPGSLFAALGGTETGDIGRLFSSFSLNKKDVDEAVIFGVMKKRFRGGWAMPRKLGGIVFGSESGLRHRVINRAWTSRPTPILDKFSIDFTDLAKMGEVGFLIGHKEEYDRLTDVLSRPTNPNVLLIGEAGIGKETLIARLAFDIMKDNVPPALFDKRLVGLQLSRLVAGANQEDLQLRLQAIVAEMASARNIILYIPDIHNLVKTSGTAYMSAADALLPIISNHIFPVIGTTFPREYKEFLEPRSDFTGIFESVRVNEISEEEARRVLIYESLILEKEYKTTITFEAVKESVRLAKKFLRTKFLPSSAEDLLKESLTVAKRLDEKILVPDRVVAVAETKVNVPIHVASGAERETLLKLEDEIHKRLIGQEEAVKAISNALREYRSGLARSSGPIASFLFVGPTGVGKTELAKIVAEMQFGSEKNMVRFDMTEYQDKQSFFRFIGSPDGRTSGALTDAILDKPYSLILLDEFEKAYPDILNLFLQVLDDGRLTDNLGRTVDFQNTIVIATSNAHSDIINSSLAQGQAMDDIAEYLKRKLTDVFRPELLNRFSKIVIFRDLKPDEVKKIAELNFKDLAKTLDAQNIKLGYTDEAVAAVAKWGYDPSLGARPLRRVLEEKVRSVLATKILAREIPPGSLVSVGFSGEDLDFEVKN